MHNRDRSQFWPLTKRRAVAVGLSVLSIGVIAGCGRSGDPEEETTSTSSTVTTVAATVPTTAATTTTTTRAQSYIVQSGDSLSIIAQQFGISTDKLADFNAIANSDSIQVGQELAIPPADAATSTTVAADAATTAEDTTSSTAAG